MAVVLPVTFATLPAIPNPAASLFDQNFIALANAINAILATSGVTINAQTGITYTVVVGDLAKLVTFTNAAAIAVTLPQAIGTFTAPWFADFACLTSSTGSVTITPTTSSIDGAASIVLRPGQSLRVVSDGTNYQVERGLAGITRTFVSSGQTITSAGALTLAHGLVAQPIGTMTELVNTTGEVGYSIGDRVQMAVGAGNADNRGVSITADSANLNIRYGGAAGAFEVLNKTTGIFTAITNGSWQCVFRAWA